MNMKERRIWLSQINRIHLEQKQAREREIAEQAASLINMKKRETETE